MNGSSNGTELADFTSKLMVNPLHSKQKKLNNINSGTTNGETTKYIASTIRKRYVRHIGTQIEDDHEQYENISSDETIKSTRDGNSTSSCTQKYLENSKVLQLPWLVDFLERYFFGRFDFRIPIIWGLVGTVAVLCLIAYEIREAVNEVQENRGCTPAIKYSIYDKMLLIFLYLSFLTQWIETIRFNSKMARDKYFQRMINKICVIVPHALKNTYNNKLDRDNDQDHDDNDDDDDDDDDKEEEHKSKQLLRYEARKNRKYLLWPSRDENKIDVEKNKVDFNMLAYLYMVKYAVILWLFLSGFVVLASLYFRIITGGYTTDNKGTGIFFTIAHGFRIPIWMATSLVSTISAMQWLWILRVLHGSLLFYAKNITLDNLSELEMLENLVHVQSEVETITSYWTVNHIIRIIITYFQVFTFGYMFLLFLFYVQLNTSSATIDSTDPTVLNLVILAAAFFLSMILLLSNSLFHIFYAGYINDSYVAAIRNRVKEIMVHFELNGDQRRNINQVLQGFSTGNFESGILYASFNITINQAILMFTALSYIALFFVQYANFMIGLLLEQDEEC